MEKDTFHNVLSNFKEDFRRIKDIEFPSNRKSDTGIGKTLEDLMGVEENNETSVDYQNQIEIKSQRQFTTSMITLFTKQPQPKGIINYIKDNYGIQDKTFPEINILHTTLTALDFNIKTSLQLN